MGRSNTCKWDKLSSEEGALFMAQIAMNEIFWTLERAGMSTEGAAFVKEQMRVAEAYQRKLRRRMQDSTRACRSEL